ncbi:endonuclease/exonuclease/phosphatase family protein [Otariodibacter oris]|uniref:Endonuclease/exonuclease/phosphatase (EEP) superfamily protein YafD n=1 Tax=Otariodibacter oris TaxID=1032623 RepID=A0A420XEQ3_9PAST|nr:endonuclease/exonuclease/phosphatase family protein [Otariodibacter oris]QGM80131.1 endonuclease [Otariodibacter oris]RKR70475.1 endonuclease/exonuclease/phosphatase (EEP) superfamily protein YafD [Otariodibacter oris]
MTNTLLTILYCLPVVATLLPLLPINHWTVRIFDFPRLQIAFLNLICLVLSYFFYVEPTWLSVILHLLNIGCFAYQLWEISAYTRLAKKQVIQYHGKQDERSISLLTTNVLTPNREAHKLLALIEKWQPDVVLTLESDKWWEEQLAPIEKSYTYTVKIPLDNLYGMHLYSRLPLRNTEVRHWVQEDIPSIYTEACLPSGEWIHFYCLHPMPPTPTESATSTNRDAELLLVGQEIKNNNKEVLVFGDLNDVAWSSTSRLFQRTSGLLDPRIGRGLFSTFHAKYPFLRWPLDHIFHSNDFMMREIRVLPEIGSDHFPVYGSFQFKPEAENIQDTPDVDKEDHKEAKERIDMADPEKKVIFEKY